MKITDKMRLDFLQRQKGDTEYTGDSEWEVADFDCVNVGRGTSLRQAIDSAIKAEKRSKRT